MTEWAKQEMARFVKFMVGFFIAYLGAIAAIMLVPWAWIVIVFGVTIMVIYFIIDMRAPPE